MAEEPDRLRRDIEGTRASLTRDVDLLAEKTSPRQVARRRWTAVKERVMGTTDHARHATGGTMQSAGSAIQSAGSTVTDKAQDAAEAVRGAPEAVARQTQGNPIAAGVIAFGVGMLAATLIPVSEAEQRAGAQIRENSGELADRVRQEAREVGSDLKEDVQQAATQVKQTAQDAARTTTDQARSAAQQR